MAAPGLTEMDTPVDAMVSKLFTLMALASSATPRTEVAALEHVIKTEDDACLVDKVRRRESFTLL